jgi:hypothetical protein
MTDQDRIAQLESACRALVKALKLSNAFAVSCANKHLGPEAAKSVATLTKAQEALDAAAMVLERTRASRGLGKWLMGSALSVEAEQQEQARHDHDQE